ncbi:MAG: carboxypeptidase regulatory-like domain-containing protein [Bacteroidales bacterium]|nr:carboxypeptidase regulatory-like domain-containing protein [Bacteroidales bacterium]
MRKLLTLMLLAVMFAGSAYSQFVSYGFMPSNGTYTEISGGTLFGTTTSDDQYFTDPANPTTSATTGPGTPIGFDFVFNGITFDRIGVNNNGWISFGQSALTPSVNMATSSGYTPLSSTSVPAVAIHRNRIAGFARDLQAQAGASLRVETIGTAPNRVCVIQFQNYKRYGSTGTGDVLNFQIRLNETSNTVQLVYGPMTIASTFSPEPQVGLGGTVSTEFVNRMSTTSWANSVAGTTNASTMAVGTAIYPASGLTYTFGPMAPLAASYSSPANGSTGMPTNVSINWAPNTGDGGGAPAGYRVYMGTDNPPTNVANGVDVGNVLSYTPAAPLGTATLYNWQVVPYNTVGNATGNATWSFTTTLGVGTLEGYTTNGFGIPLGGVNVSLFNGLTTSSVVSEPNGFYQFSLISAGNYQLTASLATYNNTVLDVYVAPTTTTYQNVVMLRPSMAVTPNPYSVAANPNEMVDGALNIANNGDGVLGWNASISYTSPGPNSWLTLGQTSGTVAAYTNFSAPLYFNATGLTVGTVKTAEITFTSTPNVGTVVVPVTMTVAGVELGVPFELEANITNPVSGAVSLTWSFEANRAFQYFIVKRDGVQVATTANTAYAETLPTYGVYSYTVQAVYDEGNSAPAGPVVVEWANPTLVLAPTSLYNEQYPNSSETVSFRISNTGEGTLAYSFPEYAVRQLVSSPGFTPNVRSSVKEVEVAKGQVDPTDNMGNRNLRGAGGPDAFGYMWIDSDEAGGPAFSWQDISGTGTLLTGFTDDSFVGPVNLGINFPFYANTYGQVYVSSNGFLSFGSGNTSLSNQNIPSSTTPNDLIAWFWDDMNPTVSGTVHYQTIGNEFVIQFTNYNEYGGTGKITAQVRLNQNGDIMILYKDIIAPLDILSATVGIENTDGTIATNVNYNSAYVHNNLALWIGLPVPSFITSVVPAAGQVAAGEFVDVVATFTSDDEDFPVGTYANELELSTNDLANETVMIPATMVVYNPGMLSGNVTSAVDGSPIHGAVVTAGGYVATTDEEGNYSMIVDAGSYDMSFSKTGFTSEFVTGVVVTETNTTVQDAVLEEVFYSPTLVNAVVNDEDTQTEVTWGVPEPDYEALYDDGTAENYAAWALPGNINAVKFTPAGYPATVYGGRVFVGDGSFPNNNTGFIGTTFGAVVYAADGANGMPGTVLDSISVTVNNLGWVDFTGLNAVVSSGSFYLGMVQGAISPNCAPVGIDQNLPTVYRSYSRNVTTGGAWGLSPFQDMMIRAFINSPIASDDAVASTITRSPLKQRGMISQSPATAQSGAEGEGQFLAIQDGSSNRDVTSYKVWRVSGFDPNAGPEAGTLTLLSGTVANTNYTDAAYGPLPQGWYAYAVAANYTNGGESPKVFSNIVGHKLLVTVTCNVSLTTGGSPAGATVGLYGQDYPYATYFATVPEDGTVVFENVWKGNYTLEALKVGFDDYVLTPNITSNRTFDILLLERKYKPRNLYVDGLTLVATWDEPLAIAVAEDFEGATFPPAGWQALTQNTTGWYATTNGSSGSWTIPAHTKYAVTNDDADNGDGCCDYLITPEMDWTNLPSYRLNFASFYDGAFSQSAYVEISTDAGATWTVINTLSPATSWQDLEIDLAQYSGATGLSSVWLAFHADDNGAWASGWAIDDVQLASGGVPLQGYGVFLDGTLVDNTPERTYTYTNLNYGQSYLAGVAALFSSGYSDLDTYRFTSVYLIPPTNLEGNSPELTDYVNLSWLAPVVPTSVSDNQERLPATESQPAADIATVNTPRTFAQTNVPLGSSRNILYDNGPLVNSPGTGAGGADESILQSDLGMGTYGFGMQQTAGNTVADDFEVTGNWNIENFEFFGYQTGSTTTSTFTGVFCRVWDGDPTAGGTVIWGDLTTNVLESTEWANIYRNNNGPGGATDRPVMRIVAATDGLTLAPGTYWVEWQTTGSGSSGPWVPAITITGQTTTGNAIQNQAGTWVALTDVGPQGLPFIINGTGGGGGQTVANLLGYNIYRDNALTAYVEKPAVTYTDLNLMPGTYSYHITAVYDLTPYGFAGQTGESMIEGPIDVTVTYGYELPFTENFNTGLFETNQWTVDAGNWRIAGQVGNEAPSAEFYYNPSTTDYSQSLTSFYLIGSGIIDGKIMLDFDLKNTIVNATELEFLAVEINNGGSWVKVAEYNNVESTDWTAKSVDITGQAKGKVFRVRFTAYGANTLDIFNWLIDNISIYRVCAPPTDLTAAINFPAVDEVILNWEAPGGSGGGPSAWLGWDNGTNNDAIGLTGGGTFSIAVRFTPAQLAQYAGTSLTKLRFFPYAAGTFVLKVWTGANASQLVVTQPVASPVIGEWNEVALTSPVPVTGTTEVWFGYTVTHAANDFPAGVDAGPAVAGYGDMISLDGSVWESMATAYSLNYNWNMNGFVETIDGVTALEPINDNTVYGPVSQLVRGFLPMSPKATVTNTTTTGSRELVGYNVWRDGVVIGNTTETTYVDETVIIGNEYCYQVQAVYEDCESGASEEACIFVSEVPQLDVNAVSVYPNPASNVVNIELTNGISQVVVYNYVGQVVYEQNITKAQTIQLNVRNYESGAYLVKFITSAGESFTKKVVVTK